MMIDLLILPHTMLLSGCRSTPVGMFNNICTFVTNMNLS